MDSTSHDGVPLAPPARASSSSARQHRGRVSAGGGRPMADDRRDLAGAGRPRWFLAR